MPISSYLQTTAWVLEKETLKIVDDIISARLEGWVRDLHKIEMNQGAPLKNSANSKPYHIVDGVAVIMMNGVMGKRMGMLSDISGGVSTQRIQMQLEDAFTDPSIVAIVLSVDSPGGTVDGTAELGDFILETRDIKPIHAYVDGQMASGGYWVGSVCHRITAFRTSQVGSLSAVLCHYDRSRADKKAGLKRTFITSGEYKRIANDAEPLSEKGEAYLQKSIDRYHAMFIETVAEGRGIDPEDVQNKYGDGQMHIADAALEIGMIDAIGTLTETIDAAREAAQENGNMNKAELEEKFPKVHASLIAEGRAQAQEEFEGEVKTQTDAVAAAEQERLCGLYGTLHGADAQEGFEKLAAAGMDASQIEALEACGFGKQKISSGEAVPGGDAAKKKILANLEDDETNESLNSGGSGDGSGDFMAVVDAMVAEKGITRVAAMKKVAADSPGLHADFLKGKSAV